MNWKWTRLVWVILAIYILVACGGVESQAVLTLTPEPSPTASPVPTNTPEPTYTPQPTATPAPTTTPSPMPTSTPQVGDTRDNPETDVAEIYNKDGQWVEAVQVGDTRINPETNNYEVRSEDGWIDLSDSELVQGVYEIDGNVALLDPDGKLVSTEYELKDGKTIEKRGDKMVVLDSDGRGVAEIEQDGVREYQAWEIWPTEAEIEAVLDDGRAYNSWPLGYRIPEIPWHTLKGVVVMPEFTNTNLAGGYEAEMSGYYYFRNVLGETVRARTPIFSYNQENDRRLHFMSQQTGIGGKDEAGIIEYAESRAGFDQPGAIFSFVWFYVDREEYTGTLPEQSDGTIREADIAAMIYDQYGITKEIFDKFIETGDTSYLPVIDGEPWIFPNQAHSSSGT